MKVRKVASLGFATFRFSKDYSVILRREFAKRDRARCASIRFSQRRTRAHKNASSVCALTKLAVFQTATIIRRTLVIDKSYRKLIPRGTLRAEGGGRREKRRGRSAVAAAAEARRRTASVSDRRVAAIRRRPLLPHPVTRNVRLRSSAGRRCRCSAGTWPRRRRIRCMSRRARLRPAMSTGL